MKNFSITCPQEFTLHKENVTYGTLIQETYFSKSIGVERHCQVLLPPNYSAEKKYPVWYLLHGILQDEYSFTGDENNHIVELFGNLFAQNLAKEMIVVFPNMYATSDPNMKPEFNPATLGPYLDFEKDLISDLIPFISTKYSVKTGKGNSALGGFSLGGRQSLWISILHPEIFGYVCAIAPAPGLIHTKDWAMEHEGLLKEDDVKFATEKPNLLMICAGDSDTVVGLYPKSYHELFEKNKESHIWYEVPGADHDSNAIKSGIFNFAQNIF